VNVAGSTFTLKVVDVYNNQLVLTRTLEIEDATKGMIGTVFTEEDIDNLDSLRYHYGIYMVDSNGAQRPLYVDDNYSASGVIEVDGTAYPVSQPSAEPAIGAYNSGVAYTDVVEVDYNAQGNNTAAYYLTGFTGTITAQGHLEDSATVVDSDYIDIASSTYTDQTGVVYVNFVGLFTGVRFKIEQTAGTVDKILYKY
jgi:hypothetical protein